MLKKGFFNQKLGKKTSRRQALARWKGKVAKQTKNPQNQKGKAKRTN